MFTPRFFACSSSSSTRMPQPSLSTKPSREALNGREMIVGAPPLAQRDAAAAEQAWLQLGQATLRHLGEHVLRGRVDGFEVAGAGHSLAVDEVMDLLHGHSIVLMSSPTPSMDVTTTSPGWQSTTPSGVPVRIRSPGCSVMKLLKYSTRKGTSKIMSRVLPLCVSLPFTVVCKATFQLRPIGPPALVATLWMATSAQRPRGPLIEQGTVLVKDLFAGSSGSNPINLTNVGGTLFFRETHGPTTEFAGLDVWTSLNAATGNFLNINATTYDLWRSNQYSSSVGTLSFPKLLEAVGLMAS